jgi:hypothetical protein
VVRRCPVVPTVPVPELHSGQHDELLEPGSDRRMGIGHRTRAHSTRLKRTSYGRAIAPYPQRSGDLAEALQLIGAEVELDGPGRVQDGLRA